MKLTLIVTDDKGNKVEREWSPQNKREVERRKEFLGRMLNEIEQEMGCVIQISKKYLC